MAIEHVARDASQDSQKMVPLMLVVGAVDDGVGGRGRDGKME